MLLNMLNDLAEAMKALDGKKSNPTRFPSHRWWLTFKGTFTSADPHLLQIYIFTLLHMICILTDLRLHTLTSADLHLHTSHFADLHLHTLTLADPDLHTFTSSDPPERSFWAKPVLKVDQNWAVEQAVLQIILFLLGVSGVHIGCCFKTTWS